MRSTLVPALALTALCAPAHAQVPADIQALLVRTANAYRGAIDLSLTLETVQGESRTTVALTLQRSGPLRATVTSEAGVRHVVADGTRVYSDDSAVAGKYVAFGGTTLADAMSEMARLGGVGVGLLRILMTRPDAAWQMIPFRPTKVEKREDAVVGGVPCELIVATAPGEKLLEYHFAIGKADRLLRRLTVRPGDGPPIVTETYSDIKINTAPAAATFVYTPAAGAVATGRPKPQPARYDGRLQIGAVPFKLVGVDLDGKAVSYEDYKGKVLLVDFWATWCGPCVAELPNVQAAYQKYHDQGFEILGISLDRKEDRAKLEKFVQEKNMPWRQIYDGGYWEAANAKSYGVQSIPFTLLIGRDGKIAAVGARGESLAPAIEAALKQ